MKKITLILTLLIISFITVTILVVTNNIKVFDDSIYNFLISLRSTPLDLYFINITKLANTASILVIVIILLLLLNKEDRLILGASAASSVVFNTIIKQIIKRPRPSHLRLITQGGYSYPSGHAMISVCVYGVLFYLVLKNIKNKKLKVLLATLLLLLIISIGLSRIYVGVHYPSDVLSGYILSTIIVITIILIYNKFRGNINEKINSK